MSDMKKKHLPSKELQHVADLSQLTLSKKEELLTPQLVSILGFVSELQKTPTERSEATSQVTGLINVFREDEVDTSRMLTQEQALVNAPLSHNGYIMVSAIFKE